VVGRVTRDGRPASGTVVRIIDANGNLTSATTAGDGSFVSRQLIAPQSPGRYQVAADALGASATAYLTVHPAAVAARPTTPTITPHVGPPHVPSPTVAHPVPRRYT